MVAWLESGLWTVTARSQHLLSRHLACPFPLRLGDLHDVNVLVAVEKAENDFCPNRCSFIYDLKMRVATCNRE